MKHHASASRTRPLVPRRCAAIVAAPALAWALTACPAGTVRIGGQVTGLTAEGLVLHDNGSDLLRVPAGASRFVFAQRLPSGSAYAVTIAAQPAGQTCTVHDGNGIAHNDIAHVRVVCGPSAAWPAGGGASPPHTPGPGDAATPSPTIARRGSAADCFNPALLTPGTRFRWHMRGEGLSWVDVSTIHGGATFAGTNDLIETRSTLTMQHADQAIVSENRHYERLTRTPAGPVVVTYGDTGEMRFGGMTMKSESINTPPSAHPEFTLAVGGRATYSATTRTRAGVAPAIRTETQTDTWDVTYLGQDEVTVAAGTFIACRFRNDFPDGSIETLVAVGSGLPLVIAGSDGDGGRIRMVLQADSSIDGVPVAAYHRDRAGSPRP